MPSGSLSPGRSGEPARVSSFNSCTMAGAVYVLRSVDSPVVIGSGLSIMIIPLNSNARVSAWSATTFILYDKSTTSPNESQASLVLLDSSSSNLLHTGLTLSRHCSINQLHQAVVAFGQDILQVRGAQLVFIPAAAIWILDVKTAIDQLAQ